MHDCIITKIATFSELKVQKKEDIEIIHANRIFDEIDTRMALPLRRLFLHLGKKNVCLASKGWKSTQTRKQNRNNAQRSLTANIRYTNVFHVFFTSAKDNGSPS